MNYITTILLEQAVIGIRDGKAIYLSDSEIKEKYPDYVNKKVELVQEMFDSHEKYDVQLFLRLYMFLSMINRYQQQREKMLT